MSAFAFGERTGRKKAFMIGVTIMSIGAVIQVCSFSVAQMIVARLITGKKYVALQTPLMNTQLQL